MGPWAFEPMVFQEDALYSGLLLENLILSENGANMAPTWVQLGSQNGAKMVKKSISKSIIFLMPLGIDVWVDFGGFWMPK